MPTETDPDRFSGEDKIQAPCPDELIALRPDLEKAAQDAVWGELPETLLALIDDLEESLRLAARNQESCEHSDAIQSLSDFHWAQVHLGRAAAGLAAACRCAIHKSKPEDRAGDRQHG